MTSTEEPTYESIVFSSTRGVNPILIYRLRSDPSKCFKFIHRRNDKFKCDRCSKLGEKDPALTVYSIAVKDNKFTSDPEQLEHKCIEAGLLFNYNDMVAQQCYREGLQLAKREPLAASVIDRYVQILMEKRLGPEAASTMQGLVPTHSRYSAYSRKFKSSQVNESQQNESDDELDIAPAVMTELRTLNSQLEEKTKRRRVRPEGFPSSNGDESFSIPQIKFPRTVGPNDPDSTLLNIANDEQTNQSSISVDLQNNKQNNEVLTLGEDPSTSIDEGTFKGEFGYSKSNKCPILIYRSKRDPNKCFTFNRKRETALGGSYFCIQCTLIYHKDKTGTVLLDKVNVEGDRFMSDPEKLYHYCIEANMTQTYMEVMVKQIQRSALILAEEESLDAAITDQLLLHEIQTIFGADAPEALAYLPDRANRLKSFCTRKNLGNPRPKLPKRVTDSGFLYEAVLGYSKDGRHPVLIVQRSDDPTKAFTFVNKSLGWFQCLMCLEARKNAPEQNKAPTIRVTDNFFHTDPEQYEHSCIGAGLELPYAKVVATQCYREGLRMAEENGQLDNQQIDAMVLDQIQKNFPDDSANASSFLPPRVSRDRGYRNRRHIGQQKREITDERTPKISTEANNDS